MEFPVQTPQLNSFSLPKPLDVLLQGLPFQKVLIDLGLAFGPVAFQGGLCLIGILLQQGFVAPCHAEPECLQASRQEHRASLRFQNRSSFLHLIESLPLRALPGDEGLPSDVQLLTFGRAAITCLFHKFAELG